MAHYTYTQSLIKTFAWSVQNRVTVGTYMMGNESCISRGRNTLTHEFLKSGLSKLLFIDADLQWEPHHVAALWRSAHKVTGGTYPAKKLPLSLNLNPLPEDAHYFPTEQRTLAQYDEWIEARSAVPVRHLPNGFMMIDRSVFEVLPVPEYASVNMRTGEVEQHREFFSMGARNGQFLSEDWYFCDLVRMHGFVPHLIPGIVLPHTGSYTFGEL